MDSHTEELTRVVKEQVRLYDRMARSIWGDRMLLAMTASTMGGMGIGLLFSDKWRARMTGALLYATAAAMQLYAAMTPKRAAMPGAEEEAAGGAARRAA
ncbi:MAG TPA: hypothetical protein VF188_17190 [Longimicrobiales bacterium]